MRDNSRLVSELKPAVMTLRMIVASLAGGVVVFALVAIWMRLAGQQTPVERSVPLLTMLALVLFPVALGASRLVAGIVVRNSRRQIVADRASAAAVGSGESQRAGALYAVFQTKTIIAAAVLEGAAFLSLFAFLLEGSPLGLVMAILLAAAIFAMFPSATRAADWIERQLRCIDEEKPLVR